MRAPASSASAATASDDKHLREITALIDPRQFDLITRSDAGLVVIQGGAGSGKTTIGLHRLAYLAFRDPRRFRPEKMLVIVFNDALVRYIAGVLPALGVAGVTARTYADWVSRMRQALYPRLPNRYSEDTPSVVTRLKKHPALLGVIRGFADARAAAVKDELTAAFSSEAGRRGCRHHAQDLAWRGREAAARSPLACARRPSQGEAATRVTQLADQRACVARAHCGARGLGVARRADGVGGALDRPSRARRSLRAARARSLHEGRARSSACLVQKARAATEAIVGEIDDASAKRRAEAASAVDGGRRAEQEALERTQGRRRGASAATTKRTTTISRCRAGIDGRDSSRKDAKLDVEDDTLLLRLHQRLRGPLTRGKLSKDPIVYEHILVDEAQDLSPLELAVVLGTTSKAKSVTLAGDVQQRMLLDNGFTDWNTVLGELGFSHVEIEPLKLSYRSTKPIVDFSRAVLGPLASKDAPVATREGAPVDLFTHGHTGDAVATLSEALRDLMQSEPQASVAVVARFPEQADLYFGGLQRAEVPYLAPRRRARFRLQARHRRHRRAPGQRPRVRLRRDRRSLRIFVPRRRRSAPFAAHRRHACRASALALCRRARESTDSAGAKGSKLVAKRPRAKARLGFCLAWPRALRSNSSNGNASSKCEF